MDSSKKTSSCCAAKRTGEQLNAVIKPTFYAKNNDQTIQFKEKMVLIPDGHFMMGTMDKDGFPADGEGPVRKIKIDSFLMDRHTVTNREFREFVEKTGYVTEAEEFRWSFVFHLFLSPSLKAKSRPVPNTPWWFGVMGADWKHPQGPASSLDGLENHPVVHISWNDAAAYASWAGKRLPTEAEWEYAARGGLNQKKYPWGDELTPGGEHQCNIWQGVFPQQNTQEDGFAGTAPADSFTPNGYGLYNMSGNVWEWCSDWFSKSIHDRGGRTNPTGPKAGETKVMRGGSYLCHESYCNRYRVAARTSNTVDSSSGHLGFRCAADLI